MDEHKKPDDMSDEDYKKFQEINKAFSDDDDVPFDKIVFWLVMGLIGLLLFASYTESNMLEGWEWLIMSAIGGSCLYWTYRDVEKGETRAKTMRVKRDKHPIAFHLIVAIKGTLFLLMLCGGLYAGLFL